MTGSMGFETCRVVLIFDPDLTEESAFRINELQAANWGIIECREIKLPCGRHALATKWARPE